MAEEVKQRNREILYRGRKIEELKAMDTREFAKLVKARARRMILRNFNVIENFVAKCDKRDAKRKPIRTHDRELVIVPKMVGRQIGIHNGKEFLKVNIVEDMLGHRLGEFALTRKIAKHTQKKA